MAELPVGYQRLEGSVRSPVAGAIRVGPADPDERMSASVCVRRRPDAPALGDFSLPSRQRVHHLTHDEFAGAYGADPEDIARIETFAREHGLTVEESSIPRRTVVVAGTVTELSAAFAVDLGRYEAAGVSYRGREGAVHLPAGLVPIVDGVFGLDNRPQARPFFRFASAPATAPPGPPPGPPPFSAADVARMYNFPTAVDATGQCIGLLEFGGGYHRTDIRNYFAWLGPGNPEPSLVDVSVDYARNSPGSDSDPELVLDIDIAGAAAPGASIAVYFAPYTEQGWVDAISTAIHDAHNDPSVLSISWGYTELESANGLTWTKSAMNFISSMFHDAALLGVTVLVASGDSGSDDGVGDHRAHVDYPASDPYVTACGGTTLSRAGGTRFRETLWMSIDSGSGGGVSVNFPVPSWQDSVAVPLSVNNGRPGRGVPDIAGNADPDAYGYFLLMNGQVTGSIGATSAVAPLYAGLVALLNANLNRRVGYLNPTLYQLADSGVFRDVTCCGTNALNHAPGYPVGVGWDATTGFGSVDGARLLAELMGPGATDIVPIIAPLLLTGPWAGWPG
jgi:kumamolisin